MTPYICDTCGKHRPSFEALLTHYQAYPACLEERTRHIMEAVNHQPEGMKP